VSARLIIGPISSIFDMTTFLIMWYIYGTNNASQQSATMLQTAWFIESLMTQVCLNII
jgi:Mg2+-importing ATPase